MLIASYERLRGSVHARDSVGRRLFCQRGLVAWLMEWGSQVRAAPQPREAMGALELPLSNSKELTLAIANVVHQAAGAALA